MSAKSIVRTKTACKLIAGVAGLLFSVVVQAQLFYINIIMVNGSGHVTGIDGTSEGGSVIDLFLNEGSGSSVTTVAGGMFTQLSAIDTGPNGTAIIHRRIQGGDTEWHYVYGLTSGFQGPTSANNLFKLRWDGAADGGYGAYFFSVLSAGYNGAGNGVNGRVTAMAKQYPSGDLYVAGNFTAAGGWTFSSGIGCYRAYRYPYWSEGWQSLFGFTAWPPGNIGLQWLGYNQLRVYSPNLSSVFGPMAPYGAQGSMPAPGYDKIWDTSYDGTFAGGYWHD